ncbi:MAG: glycosyltransferase family 39 protein [Chloroflexota bacterium]
MKKLLDVQRPYSPFLWGILLLYLLITVGYSLINPLFETPDEHFHFFTITHIVNQRELPQIPETYDPYLGPEPAQPPLYYILSALIVAPFDTQDAREQMVFNPFAWIGSADAVVNLNRTLVTPYEQWPWRGYAWPAHLVRLFSVALGLGVVLCVYSSARLLFDEPIALLSTAMVAFLPQFNFIHSAVTNDALITFLASFGIWQLIRIWQTAVSPKRLLWLGITIGLAALTKNAGLLLLIFAAGFLLLRFLRDVDLKDDLTAAFRAWVWQTAVYVVLPVLLIAGWLWVRNQMLYGDFTAANQFVDIAGGDRGYTIGQVLAESNGLWLSFFAVFGWFNLRPPEWIYWIWNVLAIMAGAGLLLGLVQQLGQTNWEAPTRLEVIQRLLKRPFIIGVLLFGWLLAVYAGLVTFMLQTEAAQGRLLFPAIVPIMLAFGYGLSRIPLRLLWVLCGLAALLTTLFSLWFVIRPAYQLPQIVEALPSDAVLIDAPMPFGVTLVGSGVETETAVADDIVWLTLYWQIDEPIFELPAFKFEILGQDLENPLGEIHTFHGRGLFPPAYWPVGVIVADRFPVGLDQVDADDVPVLARGFARVVPLDEPTDETDAEGVFVGGVKLVPALWDVEVAPWDVEVTLGDFIELRSVSVSETAVSSGETIVIDLVWLANGTPSQDYATLVHLGSPTESPLTQGDAHPRNGSYPTRIWEAGEQIVDQYQLTIPAEIEAGCYPLLLGMYSPADFQRLPLAVNGEQQQNDVYQASEICVE